MSVTDTTNRRSVFSTRTEKSYDSYMRYVHAVTKLPNTFKKSHVHVKYSNSEDLNGVWVSVWFRCDCARNHIAAAFDQHFVCDGRTSKDRDRRLNLETQIFCLLNERKRLSMLYYVRDSGRIIITVPCTWRSIPVTLPQAKKSTLSGGKPGKAIVA